MSYAVSDEEFRQRVAEYNGENDRRLRVLSAADPNRKPISWLDMSSWDAEPIPEREWAIRDRVPLKQAGLFSGEGGTGKSIIELMKDIASASDLKPQIVHAQSLAHRIAAHWNVPALEVS